MTPPAMFPFGQPVLPRRASADGPRRSFLLGAYPSALHVRWAPPPGPYRPIRAVPVDNEPEPFWNGADQHRRVERWRAEVGFDPAWGTVEPAGELNGSSGRWVDRQVLEPLGLMREEVWITDCLTTYRRSVPVHGRIQDTYNPFAGDVGLPIARLAEHPDEEHIVAEALAERHRLLEELERARPEQIITLGRAALRVLERLVEVAGERPRLELRALDGYGRPVGIRVGDRSAVWLALAHPGAPPPYRTAHARWAGNRRADRAS
jgi:hypothetical protein